MSRPICWFYRRCGPDSTYVRLTTPSQNNFRCDLSQLLPDLDSWYHDRLFFLIPAFGDKPAAGVRNSAIFVWGWCVPSWLASGSLWSNIGYQKFCNFCIRAGWCHLLIGNLYRLQHIASWSSVPPVLRVIQHYASYYGYDPSQVTPLVRPLYMHRLCILCVISFAKSLGALWLRLPAWLLGGCWHKHDQPFPTRFRQWPRPSNLVANVCKASSDHILILYVCIVCSTVSHNASSSTPWLSCKLKHITNAYL